MPGSETQHHEPAGPPGEERLRAALRTFDEGVAAHHRRLLDDLRRTVTEPLEQAFTRAVKAHEALLPAAEAEASDPWQRVRAYRDAVRRDVILPLRDALETVAPASTATGAWRTMQTDHAGLAEEMPDVVVQPEPPALYAGGTGSPVRRLRKSVVRTRRRAAALRRRVSGAAARLAGRPLAVPSAPEQRVPLRHLARYHVQVRLPHAQAPVYETLQQRLARPVASLERALSDWTNALLEEERRLDAPAHHLPPQAPRSEARGDDGDEAAPGATLETVSAQAAALQGSLEALVPLLDLGEVERGLDDAAARARHRLQEDVELADSFQLDLDARTIPEHAEALDEAAGTAVAWAKWHVQAAGRLAFHARLVTFREATLALLDEQIAGVTEQAVTPALQILERTAETLRTLGTEAEQACDDAQGESALASALGALLERAEAVLEDELLAPLRDADLEAAARAAADATAERLLSRMREQPEHFALHVLPPPGDAAVAPDADVRQVRFREVAEQTLDTLFVERLRAAIEPVVEGAVLVLVEAEQVPAIVRFNLEAAVDELAGAANEAGRDPRTSARELAHNGFARSASTLDAAAEALAGTLVPHAEAAHAAYDRGWARLHERVRAEGRMQEQLHDLRSRLRQGGRHVRERTAALAGRGRTRAARLLRLGRRRARTLVRIGQSAVGAAAPTTAEAMRTLDALAGVDALVNRFPLVYRRLFTFQPVTDPSLLENREADLAAAQRHYERWSRGLTGALVVTAFYGNGLSSFVNVLRKTVFPDVDARVLELSARIEDEADLAARLAQALDLAGDAERVDTFDGLAAALHAQPPAAPRVCIVEHLEHLLLRTIGGTRLLEDLLALMSRTDARLLWIATVSEHAWKYVETTAPIPASLVTRHVLTPVDRAALESIVMNRHRRSGLPVVFEMPDDLNPLQRRRLRRARHERDRQELLRDDFFQGLFRASGQNIMLALFHWLHAAEVRAEAPALHVHPVRPFSFAFLGSFPLSHAFTLKALLQHGTLTLDEHTRVFQTSPQESYQIFESLYNHLLIEPVATGAPSHAFEKDSIREGERYRVRPLVVHPVLQYLRGRHVVY